MKPTNQTLTARVFQQAEQHDFSLVSGWLHAYSDAPEIALTSHDNGHGKQWTLLHWLADAEAKGQAHPEIVQALLDAGANPHQGDHADEISGDTPFNIAAPSSPITGRLMTNHWLESALKSEGTKGLNDRSGSHGSTLSQYIGKWSEPNEIKSQLSRAKNRGMNVAVQNNDGWTALHAAAAMGRTHAVKAFCKVYDPEEIQLLTTNEYTAPYGVTFPANATAIEIAQARLNSTDTSEALKQQLAECVASIVHTLKK
jgi:ankyrin repeat protein